MATDQALADEIVGAVRAWVERDVMPNVAEFELVDEFPQAMFDQMCAFGLFGSTIPEEYGGLGLDITTYTRLIEEISRGYMSLAGLLNTHKIGATMIERFGTDEQRQRLLPRMCDGSFRAAFSLSESDAGSDTGALRCRAERDGDEWVINGTKMWVTLHALQSGRGPLQERPRECILFAVCRPVCHKGASAQVGRAATRAADGDPRATALDRTRIIVAGAQRRPSSLETGRLTCRAPRSRHLLGGEERHCPDRIAHRLRRRGSPRLPPSSVPPPVARRHPP